MTSSWGSSHRTLGPIVASMRPTASDSNFSLLIPSHPAPSILHGSPQNAGYSSEVVLTKAFSTRHWSDWAGTAAFAALAVGLWHQAPEFGVLILPGLLQELLVAVSFLLRGRAQVGAPSRAARLVAYANSFLVMGFILLSARFHPDWLRPTPHDGLRQVGAVIWLAAATLSLWPLWHLRRAFSLEPAARVLVTAGPYRLARHPIYAIYILINLGILLRHLTLPFAAVIAAWMALLVVRVRYEERVLSVAFPEYRDYRRRVRAFGILG